MSSHDNIMPIIDLTRCNRCGACVERCPTGALEMQGKWPVLAHPEVCSYCATCEDICPPNAIALPYQIVLAPQAQI